MTEMFEIREINFIIEQFRNRFKTQKLFGDCSELFKTSNERHLVPFHLNPKNSESMTDIIFAGARIGDDQPFETVIKLWIGWDKLTYEERVVLLQEIQDDCVFNGTPRRCLERMNIPTEELKTLDQLWYAWGKFVKNILGDGTGFAGLKYEARVYAYITENIIMKNISPNFIPLLAANECSIREMATTLSEVRKYDRDLETLSRKLEMIAKNPKLTVSMIVTGTASIRMLTLGEFLKEHKLRLSEHDARSILFQLMYALYVMESFKIMHNDLHSGNILVQDLWRPLNMRFVINGFETQFETTYILKIFDFDFAHVPLLGPNQKENGYTKLGMPVGFVKNRDFGTIMCACFQNFGRMFIDLLKSTGLFAVVEQCGRIGYVAARDAARIAQDSGGMLYDRLLEATNRLTPLGTDPKTTESLYLLPKWLVTEETLQMIRGILGVEITAMTSEFFITKSSSGAFRFYYPQNCRFPGQLDVNIPMFFEDRDAFNLLVPRIPSRSSIPDVTYTFEMPSPNLFIPPDSLNHLFPMEVVKESVFLHGMEAIANALVKSRIEFISIPVRKPADGDLMVSVMKKNKYLEAIEFPGIDCNKLKEINGILSSNKKSAVL